MNFLRSAPLRFLSLASALQDFIFSCCAIPLVAGAAAAVLPPRHSFMKLLRSAPFSFLSLASALHDFMRSCCGVSFFSAAAAGFLSPAAGAGVCARAKLAQKREATAVR